MIDVLIKKGKVNTQTLLEGRRCEDTHREDGHLQAKERGLEQIHPSQPRKEPTCQHFDLGLLVSKPVSCRKRSPQKLRPIYIFVIQAHSPNCLLIQIMLNSISRICHSCLPVNVWFISPDACHLSGLTPVKTLALCTLTLQDRIRDKAGGIRASEAPARLTIW